MPIDPKQIAEWQALVHDVYSTQLFLDDRAGMLARALDAAIIEIARLRHLTEVEWKGPIGLLREIEWGEEKVMGHGEPRDRQCPICRGLKTRGGHEPTCRLATLLPR